MHSLPGLNSPEKDDWDPNTIPGMGVVPLPPCRIYGNDRAEFAALIDAEDYQWAIQWKWSPKWSRGGKKVYLRRASHSGSREDRIQRTVWLHVEIQKRKGGRKRTANHVLVDHINGDGLDNRRHNLRYATHSMNARNRKK